MSASATAAGQWIRRYHSAPPGSPALVCFPHAGGAATYFTPMSAALAPAFDVAVVQYPGRQERRHLPCVDDVGELAQQVHDALREAGLAGRGCQVAFFGHSMGAVIGFEVARLMEHGGSGPGVLFASGRRAPGCFRDDEVHLRDDATLIEEMRTLGGTDARILRNKELLEMVLPALRSDYRAVARYRPPADVRISARIVVLTGDQDPHTTRAEAYAWGRHTTGPFEVHSFPGGHFYLEQQQTRVIETITTCLTGLYSR